MNLWEAIQETSGYVGSKFGYWTIRLSAYLVLHANWFTGHGWLLAKHHDYPILQKYSYWNIQSLSGIEYVVLRIAIQYLMSHARPGAGVVSALYETYIGSQATSLFNRIIMTLSHYPDGCNTLEYQFCIPAWSSSSYDWSDISILTSHPILYDSQ